MVVGSWWMMREIELSTVRAAHVTFTGEWDRTSLGARLVLTASKNDPAAMGTARAGVGKVPNKKMFLRVQG